MLLAPVPFSTRERIGPLNELRPCAACDICFLKSCRFNVEKGSNRACWINKGGKGRFRSFFFITGTLCVCMCGERTRARIMQSSDLRGRFFAGCDKKGGIVLRAIKYGYRYVLRYSMRDADAYLLMFCCLVDLSLITYESKTSSWWIFLVLLFCSPSVRS